MNPYYLSVASVGLPVLFWAWYHYHKDRHLPEPVGHLIVAFCLGLLSFYVGRLLYSALDLVQLRYDAFVLAETTLPGLFAYSVLVIGVIEELAKLLLFCLVVLRFKEFDEPIDGIIYASFIALGFAALENIHYLQYASGIEAFARGFAGPIVHIVFASIWGYYIGRAFLRRSHILRTTLIALAGAALLHGVYDFIVIGLPAPAWPIAAAVILGAWLWRLLLLRDLHIQAAANDTGIP